MILVDGTVRKVKKVDGTVIGRMGPLEQATDPESFNEAAHQHLYQGAKSGKSMTCQYLIEGRNFEPLQLEKETVSLHLDLHAVENAAGEREGIEFDLFAKVRELELDLLDFQSGLLSLSRFVLRYIAVRQTKGTGFDGFDAPSDFSSSKRGAIRDGYSRGGVS